MPGIQALHNTESQEHRLFTAFLYAIEITDDLSKSEEEQIVFPTAASLGDEPFLPSGGSREGQISVTSTDDNVAPELKMMLYFKSR